MSSEHPRTFSSDFKLFFVRGLAVLLPTVLTLWIVVQAYKFVDGAIAEPINQGIRLCMEQLTPYWQPLRDRFEPDDQEVAAALASAGSKPPTADAMRSRLRATHIADWWSRQWYLDLIGLIVAIISVYVAGRLLGGYIGRRIYRQIERLITSLPVFKQVYPYVKQVVDFLFSQDKQIKFNRVVVLEYPRKGIWSLGFVTGGTTMKAIARTSGDAVVVFIPNSPTPFTGFAITVPRSEVIDIPLTIEEAILFVVSGGVLIPDHQAELPPGEGGSGDALPDRAEQIRQRAIEQVRSGHAPPATHAAPPAVAASRAAQSPSG